jgi:hypothetical protein
MTTASDGQTRLVHILGVPLAGVVVRCAPPDRR